MRQPRGVMDPQSSEAAGTPQTGPTPERSSNSSTQAAINAVPGRAWPRKKPTPSSISRSPASIARPRPADSSTPPSRPRPTAWSPARPRIPGDLFDRPGLRRIRAARLGQQPDGLRLELRRVSRAFCHGSIISHRVRGNDGTKISSYHRTERRNRLTPSTIWTKRHRPLIKRKQKIRLYHVLIEC